MSKEKSPKGERSQNTIKATVAQAGDLTRPKSVSVYLSSKDKQSLDEIAKKYNINRHMLLSYAVRYFLANYRAGHVKLDPTIEAGRVVLSVNLPLDGMDN